MKTPPTVYLLPEADHQTIELLMADAIDLLGLLQGFMIHAETSLMREAGGKHLSGVHPLLEVISDKLRTASDLIDSVNLTPAEEVRHD